MQSSNTWVTTIYLSGLEVEILYMSDSFQSGMEIFKAYYALTGVLYVTLTMYNVLPEVL